MVHTIRIQFGAQAHPKIEIQQGDYNSRVIQALCYTSSGAAMSFDGQTVSVVYSISGTVSAEYPVQVTGNVLSFTMPGLASASVGAGSMQVRIYGSESLLQSAIIPYVVKASLDPGPAEEDQIPMLVMLVQQAQQAIAGANAAASTANQAAQIANTAANLASEKAGLAQNAASSANEAATNATNSAELAQTAADNANSASESANSAAGTANNAADNANSAAESANNAATNANQVADEIQQKADSGAFNGKDGLNAPQIDDTQITTTNPWSSMQIVNTLCPPFTVSGATVQCTPVANYPLGVKASWEPHQEGEGDPSPENVRPITGLDAVTVTLSGSAGTGTTATLTLPKTIYGGTVDAVTGEGVETWLYHLLTSSNTTVSMLEANSNETSVLFGISRINGEFISNQYGGTGSWVCSHLPYLAIAAASSIDNGIQGNPAGSMFYIRLNRAIANDIQEFLGWLDAQSAAGTPVQVAYKLATPTAFQATGGQSLPALPGTNTVYTDADTVTVSGLSDPIATIASLQARVSALESAQTNM